MIEHYCHECVSPVESPDSLAGGQDVCRKCGATVCVPEDVDDNLIVTKRQVQDAQGRITRYLEESGEFNDEDASDAANKWIPACRYAGAILAYWIYWLVLWGGMTAAVGPTLSPSKVDYGWGDHYILFLLGFCVAVGCASVLSGAMAKRNGAVIASVANVPVALLMVTAAYFHYTGGMYFESPNAWGIILPLAVIGSIIGAIVLGKAGEENQADDFPDNTVLGIRAFHWAWIWLPASVYVWTLSSTVARLLVVCWASLDATGSIVEMLLFLLVFLPVSVLAYAVVLMYRMLSGEVMAEEDLTLRIPAFVGVYICGLVVGMVVDWLCMSALRWMLS